MVEKYHPAGLQDVIPYLIVENADKLIEFIAIVFDADVLECSNGKNNKIATAILKVGDSIVEVADANENDSPRPCSLHVYVPDADGVYARALDAGATPLFTPTDHEYGERLGGVQDPFGNHWFIATLTNGNRPGK